MTFLKEIKIWIGLSKHQSCFNIDLNFIKCKHKLLRIKIQEIFKKGLHYYQRKDKCSVTIPRKHNIATEGGSSCRVGCDKNKICGTFHQRVGMGHTTTLNFKAKSGFIPGTLQQKKYTLKEIFAMIWFSLPSVAEFRMIPLKDPGTVICQVVLFSLSKNKARKALTFHCAGPILLTATLRLSGVWAPWPGLMSHRGAPLGQVRTTHTVVRSLIIWYSVCHTTFYHMNFCQWAILWVERMKLLDLVQNSSMLCRK